MSTADPRPRGRLDPIVARARNLVEPHLAGPVVVGVSGGADSLGLAACAGFFARKGADVRAVVIDHQLQDGSADVARRAVLQCEGLGLSASVVTVSVGDQGGPEAAARNARRAALADAAGSGGRVLLAHTLDDQAETVLLGLGRGSGARSLAGMAEASGIWRRPFLGLRRADTEQICRWHGLDWWTDPHNADPRFRRVRVRQELLPLMEDVLGGGVAEALARTADLLRTDADVLDAMAERALSDLSSAADAVEVASLAALAEGVRLRVWRLLALREGARAAELTRAHTLALDGLLCARGGTRIELPGGVAAVREGSAVRLRR